MKEDKNKSGVFSEGEREAMRARAKELASEAKFSKNKEQGEKDVLAAINEMTEPDKMMAKRIHEIIKSNVPSLLPKTWYGMPAYADKDGKVICFFQAASKFKSRYATFGFSDSANLDEGNMWETAFGLTKLTSTEENKIVELVKKAVK